MFTNSAFDTAACAGVPLSKLIDAATRALVSGSLPELNVRAGLREEGFLIHLVEGGNAFADEVPYFHHPLIFNAQGVGDRESKSVIIIDVRNYGRYDAQRRRFVVRNAPEYSLAVRRAILNKLWMEGRPEILRDVSDLPVMTFCALLSDTIGHRFSATPYEQSVIATLAAFYYYSQFTNDDDFGDAERHLLTGKIHRITQVPVELVQDVIREVKCLHGIESLIDTIRNHVNNPAFDNFNLATLLTLVRNSWFGSGASEIVGASMEHTPTWIALVEASVASQTFKRTPLSRLSQRFTRNNIAGSFLRSVDVLCGGPEAVMKDGETDTDYSSQSKL